MMTPINIHLVLQYLLILVWIEKSCETRHHPRYIGYGNNTERIPNDRHFNRNPYEGPYNRRSSTDLPVTFQAPDVRSENYWNYNQQGNALRRTFFHDFNFFNYDKGFPTMASFFDFMAPLLPKTNQQQYHRPNFRPQPYRFEYPYNVYATERNLYTTTERNFLPPPKPIRASIIKLETVTRPPEDEIRFGPTPNNYPKFVKLPKSITRLKDGLHIDELGFHSDPVFGQPEWMNGEVRTEKQARALEFVDLNLNRTTYLPLPINTVPPALKYTFQPVNHVMDADALEPTTARPAITTGMFEEASTVLVNDVPTTEAIKTNTDFLIDIRNIILRNMRAKTDQGQSFSNVEVSKIGDQINSARESDTEYAQRKEKDDRALKTNSIKIVTDLTLEGLMKNKKNGVNIPVQAKSLNMSELINYELDKLRRKKKLTPRVDDLDGGETEDSYSNSNEVYIARTNFDDDLSLDLKILRDTNWDGFTTELIEIDTGLQNKSNRFPHTTDSHLIRSNTSEKVNSNKTSVVETRVTKSITKSSKPDMVPFYVINSEHYMREENQTEAILIEAEKTTEVSALINTTDESTTIGGTGNSTSTDTKRTRSRLRNSIGVYNSTNPARRRRKYRPKLKTSTSSPGVPSDGSSTETTISLSTTEANLDSDKINDSRENQTQRYYLHRRSYKVGGKNESAEIMKYSDEDKPKRSRKLKRRRQGKRKKDNQPRVTVVESKTAQENKTIT